MAITKEQTPSDLNLRGAQLIYVVSSTNSSESQFRYVYDIKLDTGAGLERIARIKQTPNPNNYGIIDIAPIVEDYLKATLKSSTGSNQEIHRINSTDNNWCSLNDDTVKFVEVEFGEHYVQSGDTDPTTTANLTNDEIYVLDGAHQFEDGLNWTFDPYVADGAASRFLSNAPTIEYVESDQYRTLAWCALNDGTIVATAGTIRVTFYDSSNTPIQQEDIDISLSGGADPTTGENKAVQFFGCGPQNFEEGSVANLKPSNNPTLSWYTIRLRNAANNATASRAKAFYINDDKKYTPKVLAWQNRFGTWDYYSFQMKSTRNISMERGLYVTPHGDYSGSSYSYQTWERGRTTFGVKAYERVTVNSDYLTDEEYEWLEELLTSKEVYEIGTTTRAVVIEDTSFDIKTGVNDKLRQLAVKYRYAHDRRV